MKLSLVLLAIASLLAAAHAPSPSSAAHHNSVAPAPAVDCFSLILNNIAECLSYVSNDSTTTKPEPGCCSGLKTVLRTSAECICEAFKTSGQYGVVLNVTKALTLPAACKLSAPSIATCGLSPSPSPSVAPAGPGVISPSEAKGPAPVPTPGNTAPAGRTISSGHWVTAVAIGLFLAF